jgi:hypothetical protein
MSDLNYYGIEPPKENLFDQVRSYLYAVRHKSLRKVLREISMLTEGLSVAVRQIADLSASLPGFAFTISSISSAIVKRSEMTVKAFEDLDLRLKRIEASIRSLEAEMEALNTYIMVPGDIKKPPEEG